MIKGTSNLIKEPLQVWITYWLSHSDYFVHFDKTGVLELAHDGRLLKKLHSVFLSCIFLESLHCNFDLAICTLQQSPENFSKLTRAKPCEKTWENIIWWGLPSLLRVVINMWNFIVIELKNVEIFCYIEHFPCYLRWLLFWCLYSFDICFSD